LLALVAACGFEHGTLLFDAPGQSGDGPHAGDAPTDTTNVTIDAPPECSSSGLVCAGVPSAVMCNGACWVKCTQIGVAVPNQGAAALSCASWGGKLAPIRDQGDQDCVAQMLFPGQSHWIGFEQSSTATSLTAGWTWNSDGIAPTYTHWGAGQPNDTDGDETDHSEQCATMNTAGDWHDTPCDDNNSYRFSCRK